MDTLAEHFVNAHPKDAAAIIESSSKQDLKRFAGLINRASIAFLPFVSPERALYILEHVSEDTMQGIVSALSDKQLATLVNYSDIEKKDRILQYVSEDLRNRIDQLLAFNENQVGYYTQKPALLMLEDNTVGQAFKTLDGADERDLPIYLVNTDQQLIGTVNLIKLLQVREHQELPLREISDLKTQTIRASTPIENLLSQNEWKKSQTIGVTGTSNLFLGVVSADLFKQRVRSTVPASSKTTTEEYIFFTDMLWTGLSKFWGTLK